MAFAYSPAHAVPLDRVRFALGDTADAGHLLEDETILPEIAARGEAGAIAYLAGGLAARLARDPDRMALPSGLSVTYSRVKAYEATASRAGGASGAGSATASRLAARDDGDDERSEYGRPEGWNQYLR